MPDYRRCRVPGGTYFFTVNLLERRGDLLVRHVEALRSAVRETRRRMPFHIDAWVVLPDHLHCVWTLPLGDADFSNRWKAIKIRFVQAIPDTERRSAVRVARGERAIWQRRFWEHVIRDETDYARHVDYVHVNPVKHGYVRKLADWPYSSFHRWVAAGLYPPDWCGAMTMNSKRGSGGDGHVNLAAGDVIARRRVEPWTGSTEWVEPWTGSTEWVEPWTGSTEWVEPWTGSVEWEIRRLPLRANAFSFPCGETPAASALRFSKDRLSLTEPLSKPENTMTVAELVYEQIKALPEDQAREVLDFIGYLKEKGERAEWEDLMRAQTRSLAAVWDNPDDEVWNAL